jgi:hypothetical protein
MLYSCCSLSAVYYLFTAYTERVFLPSFRLFKQPLSDKTAQKEFNLELAEILEAIKSGKLQYRHNTLYGNPCFKLLRNEVENKVN